MDEIGKKPEVTVVISRLSAFIYKQGLF